MNRLAQNSIPAFQKRIQYDTPRAALNFIKERQQGMHPNSPKISPNAVVSEGYLRLEANLTARDTYDFNVLANEGSQFVTEKRLKVSDQFLVTMMGMYVISSEELATDAGRSTAALGTFNNNVLRALQPTVENGEALWNSSLQIRVDETVYFDAYDTIRFKRVGQAQEGVAASAFATENFYLADEWESADYGQSKLTPFIFFGGRSNNKVSLNLPSTITFEPDVAAVVLIFRGMQIQNAYGE